MMIVLTGEDLAAFSDATQTEILRRLQSNIGAMPSASPSPAPHFSGQYNDINAVNLEDITAKHIGKWMDGLSAPVRAGALMDAGINIKHFQSATTRRTRALTRDPDAFFVAWNNWAGMDDAEGKYAVSPITHQSLRRYFRLD